jgi:hypothetical protein
MQLTYRLRLTVYNTGIRLSYWLAALLPPIIKLLRFKRKPVARAYREGNRWYAKDFNGFSKSAMELVGGITEIIMEMAGHDASLVRITYGECPFEGSSRLELITTDCSGSTYQYFDGCRYWLGWLCPVFFWYFPKPPQDLYVRIEPLRTQEARS